MDIELITPHIWVNYVLAGYNAVVNYVIEKNKSEVVLSSVLGHDVNLIFTGKN